MRLLLEITAACLRNLGQGSRGRASVADQPFRVRHHGLQSASAVRSGRRGAASSLGIGFLDVVEGATGRRHGPMSVRLHAAACPFQRRLHQPNNSYTLATGSAAIRDGRADMISFGRSFIANPDLVERHARGLALNSVNPTTIYGTGEAGYHRLSCIGPSRPGAGS